MWCKPCPRSPVSQLRSWPCRKPGRAVATFPSKTTGNLQFSLIWTSSSQFVPGEGLGKAGSIRAALRPGLPLHGTEQRFGKSKPFSPWICSAARRADIGAEFFPCSSHALKAGGTHRVAPSRVSDLPTQHHPTPSSSAAAIPYHDPNHPPSSAKLHLGQAPELTPPQSPQPSPAAPRLTSLALLRIFSTRMR